MSLSEEQRARMERMKKVAQEKKKWKDRAQIKSGGGGLDLGENSMVSSFVSAGQGCRVSTSDQGGGVKRTPVIVDRVVGNSSNNMDHFASTTHSNIVTNGSFGSGNYYKQSNMSTSVRPNLNGSYSDNLPTISNVATPASDFYKPQTAPLQVSKGNFRSQNQLAVSRLPVPSKVITATCSLTSRSRFEVLVAYHAPLIEIFKSIASGQYNAKDKVWSFALYDHDLLLQKSRGLAPGLVVSPLPTFVRDAFRKSSDLSAHLGIDLGRVEPHLRDQLMPFQREGVQYGISRQGRVMIADDMGLGKTVQALGLASHYRDSWPLLIIAPSSMRFAWEAAVLKWLPAVGPQDVSVITTGKDFIGDSLVVILSYDLVKKKKEELLKKEFQFVILDESHMIKDSKSGRSQAVEPLAKNSRYLVLLTGTPALSRPIELYSQIAALQPRLFPSVTQFGNRYCDGKKKMIGNREVPDFSGSSHMTELSLLLQERCMIRRLKKDVLDQLPAKQRCMVVLDPAGVSSGSREMKEKKKEAEKEGLKGMDKRASLLQWFAATAEAKLKAVQGYIKDLLSSDKKFLVFCHHQTMMKGIESMLEKEGVGFIKIEGKVSSEARKTSVDRFQTVDSVKVALLSITAANAGITLTAAQLVVFAELFWNPGVLCQAEDRVHRIGQTDSVVCQYLVARGTADDSLWPMIQKKLVVLNKAGLSKDNFEESEEKNMEMEKQKTLDEFFQAKAIAENESSAENTDDLWGSLKDEDDSDIWSDFDEADLEALCDEPEAKKARL